MPSFCFTAIPAMTTLAVLALITGCAGEPKKSFSAVPDYIGTTCEMSDRSRIVTAKELYAVCLNSQWVLVSGDQFGIYKVMLESPVKRPDLIMQKPSMMSGGVSNNLCITVTEFEVGWADVDYEGSVMRFPLVDGSCSLSPCGKSPKAYQPGICQ